MNFKRRVGRLEKEMQVATQIGRFRIECITIIGAEDPSDGSGEPGGRAEEPRGLRSCKRYFGNGRIFETVWINGSRDGISDDELERFVESFPIAGLPPNQKFRIAGADRKN